MVYKNHLNKIMAVNNNAKVPFYTFNETALRLGIFCAHAISAFIMLMKAFGVFDESGCKPIAFTTSRQVTAEDSFVKALEPKLYPLIMDRVNPILDCRNDTSWNQGWCKAKNLPMYFDYDSDVNSFVFGSSWNIIFAVTVFEWITASYALFYFDPFDSWLDYQGLIYGLHPIPSFCSIWNLLLILLMWGYRTRLNVPPNNAFLYTMALAVTIVIQNVLAINRSWKIDMEKEEPSAMIDAKDASVHTANYMLRTDIFLRNRKRGDYKPLPMNKNSTYDFHEESYMILFDKCCCSPIPRYLEYFITAPLLLAALYASSVPNDLTWKYQYILVALIACNAIGVPLHYSVLNIGCDLERYTKAAFYFFVSSWLSLIVGLYIFIWTLREFLIENDSGMPQWVQVLIWMMIILYSLFGVVASRYYLPRIMYETKFSSDDYRWLGFYFDVLSLSVKLPVAWTIWMKGATLMCEKSVTC
jgi:hypothetical protein